MAEAIRTEKVVRVDTVTLTLSIDEAEALRAVVGSVWGDENDSPRKHIDAIWNALRDAGVPNVLASLVSEEIRFDNYPDED